MQTIGGTPLHIACEKGYPEVVSLLLAAGANKDDVTVCNVFWSVLVNLNAPIDHV